MANGNKLSEEQKALLAKISRGAAITFANGAQLYDEAQILGLSRHFARALFLHQISLEECAKVELLGGWATALLMDSDVSSAKLMKSFTSHKAKNHINAYMLEISQEERDARDRSDLKGAVAAFSMLQDDFHERSNAAKNAALYVDFTNGTFSSPVDQITEAMAIEAQKRNGEFLALMNPKVQMLAQWVRNPDEVREMLLSMKGRLEQAKDKSSADGSGAIDGVIVETINEMLKAKAAATS
jgi:AbiV family abortive infection protein